ncbi:MAG: alpha/beta hydrolase [Pseudomonadota bacterium]
MPLAWLHCRPQVDTIDRGQPLTGRARAFLILGLVIPTLGLAPGSGLANDAPAEVDDTGFFTTARHALPFLTVRQKRPDAAPANRFPAERGPLQYGTCYVDHTEIPGLDDVAEAVTFHVPRTLEAVADVEHHTESAFWDTFAKTAGDKVPSLYVHGYRMGFAKTCRRAARFQVNTELAGRFAVFSWPSEGAVITYARDEANVAWSVPALVTVLDRMGETFGSGRFNLVAHSLGSRAAVDALLQIGQQSRGSGPVVKELMLIAPDIDAGIFAQKVERLKTLAERVTVYVSDRDAPLLVSRELHGYPRLGQSGSHLDGFTGIDIVDVSNSAPSTPSGHLYHLFNPAAYKHMKERLGGS